MKSSQKTTYSFQDFLLVLFGFFLIPIMPFLVSISTVLWLFATFLLRFYPEYGKFVESYGVWMNEDFDGGSISRASVITTLTLDGDIKLEQLKSIFTKNVLEAQIPSRNGKRLRYPELKQFLSSFMGFRIWKNDSNFNIDNHIEKSDLTSECKEEHLLGIIHQEILNEPYHKYKSPWNIMLIRNVSESNNNTFSKKSVIAIRFHHAMADGKSILKLVVECLGNKPLKTAIPQPVRKTFVEWCFYYLTFHLEYLKCMVQVLNLAIQSHLHPWKYHTPRAAAGRIPGVVAFSPRVNLNAIKKAAKQYGANTYSIFLASVAGGASKFGKELGKQDIATGFSMPRPHHPETLTNHYYLGCIMLPSSLHSPLKRLRKCQEAFTKVKTTGFLKFGHIQAVQAAMLPTFLAKHLAYNYYYPIGFTNIAGDEEGFSILNLPCSGFELSVACPGYSGLGISFCSYKDSIRIGVTSKENLLDQRDAEILAYKISMELKNFLYQAHFAK